MGSVLPIPFNIPYLTGHEGEHIQQLLASGKISSNGTFTRLCEAFFKEKYQFPHVLLTSSGTSALEMAALLLDIMPGDEVILPSYTFTSTANAFALRGAKLVFADSEANSPNMDAATVLPLITERTKAVVVVHYGGTPCDLEKILALCTQHELVLVEDAAQAIDAFYQGKPLGSFGQLAAFSFHETKNIVAGEGGMLVLNHPKWMKRADLIREKGTNRSAFLRGETDKYTWCSLGSSYLPSEMAAAILWAQLQQIDTIQAKRKELWDAYHQLLLPLVRSGAITLPHIRQGAQHNASIFYFTVANQAMRDLLLSRLKEKGIGAVFHYQSLHSSPYFMALHDGRDLPQSDRYTQCLVRLPLYPSLTLEQIATVAEEAAIALNHK